MVIYLIDDEPLQLRLLNSAVLEAEPEAQVYNFLWPNQLLEALSQGITPPDVAFLDIEMPRMGGIELAKGIKEINPAVNIVFVTGFSQYMGDALAMHVSGYVTKPATAELIRRELDNLRHPIAQASAKRAQAQTFGNFEFFIDGEPVKFKLARTKELLAYLVDRHGASCNTSEVCAVLFEDDSGTLTSRSHFRTLVSDLAATLRAHDMEALLIKQRNSFAIDTKQLDCDMYRFLGGDAAAVNAYSGEYMLQYSWAEMRMGQMSETEKF